MKWYLINFLTSGFGSLILRCDKFGSIFWSDQNSKNKNKWVGFKGQYRLNFSQKGYTVWLFHAKVILCDFFTKVLYCVTFSRKGYTVYFSTEGFMIRTLKFRSTFLNFVVRVAQRVDTKQTWSWLCRRRRLNGWSASMRTASIAQRTKLCGSSLNFTHGCAKMIKALKCGSSKTCSLQNEENLKMIYSNPWGPSVSIRGRRMLVII